MWWRGILTVEFGPMRRRFGRRFYDDSIPLPENTPLPEHLLNLRYLQVYPRANGNQFLNSLYNAPPSSRSCYQVLRHIDETLVAQDFWYCYSDSSHYIYARVFSPIPGHDSLYITIWSSLVGHDEFPRGRCLCNVCGCTLCCDSWADDGWWCPMLWDHRLEVRRPFNHEAQFWQGWLAAAQYLTDQL